MSAISPFCPFCLFALVSISLALVSCCTYISNSDCACLQLNDVDDEDMAIVEGTAHAVCLGSSLFVLRCPTSLGTTDVINHPDKNEAPVGSLGHISVSL